MPELVAHGVGVRFGETVALDNLDVRVDSGRILALVGPSGSGKSTFLRAIAGFERPSAGTIRVGDRTLVGDGIHLPPEERGLGMVFQHHAVWPHLSVEDNVAYPLRVASARITALMLRTNSFPVALEGVALRWGEATVQFDAACSGVRMLWGALFLASALGTAMAGLRAAGLHNGPRGTNILDGGAPYYL